MYKYLIKGGKWPTKKRYIFSPVKLSSPHLTLVGKTESQGHLNGVVQQDQQGETKD